MCICRRGSPGDIECFACVMDTLWEYLALQVTDVDLCEQIHRKKQFCTNMAVWMLLSRRVFGKKFHAVIMSTTDRSRASNWLAVIHTQRRRHSASMTTTHDRQQSLNRVGLALAAWPSSGKNIQALQLFLFPFHFFFNLSYKDKLEPWSAFPIWKQ